MKRIITAISLIITVGMLNGCSALTPRVIDLDSRMSHTIFLDPDKLSSGAPIYIQFSNTSTYQDVDMLKLLKQKLEARGNKVTRNSKEALFTLQANFLYLGEETKTLTMEGALLGAAVGAGVGTGITGKVGSGTAIGAGTGAGLGGFVGMMGGNDAIIGIIDIEIKERVGNILQKRAGSRIVVQGKQMYMNKAAIKAGVADTIAAQVAGIF